RLDGATDIVCRKSYSSCVTTPSLLPMKRATPFKYALSPYSSAVSLPSLFLSYLRSIAEKRVAVSLPYPKVNSVLSTRIGLATSDGLSFFQLQRRLPLSTRCAPNCPRLAVITTGGPLAG